MALNTLAQYAKPGAVLPGHADDTWQRLPQIRVPLLALVGNLDSTDITSMVERIVAAVPAASFETINGAAHMPNMEQPAAFNTALRRFLASMALHRPDI
jgi:pimeloyl-ACP methyl ester carboxylesterase